MIRVDPRLLPLTSEDIRILREALEVDSVSSVDLSDDEIREMAYGHLQAMQTLLEIAQARAARRGPIFPPEAGIDLAACLPALLDGKFDPE